MSTSIVNSLFETKLPAEIRNQIYYHCLLHSKTIMPFPDTFEAGGIERAGGVAGRTDRVLYKRCLRDRKRVFEHSSPGGWQKYDARWPCIALLGVSRNIARESAAILFGENVWAIPCPFPHMIIPYKKADFAPLAFFSRYRHFLRHIYIVFEIDGKCSGKLSVLLKLYQQVMRGVDEMENIRTIEMNLKAVRRLCYGNRLKSLELLKPLEDFCFELIRARSATNDYRPLSGVGKRRLPVRSWVKREFQGPRKGMSSTGKWDARSVADTDTGSPNAEVTIRGLLSDEQRAVVQEWWGIEVEKPA